jgi:hypothetical protein
MKTKRVGDVVVFVGAGGQWRSRSLRLTGAGPRAAHATGLRAAVSGRIRTKFIWLLPFVASFVRWLARPLIIVLTGASRARNAAASRGGARGRPPTNR